MLATRLGNGNKATAPEIFHLNPTPRSNPITNQIFGSLLSTLPTLSSKLKRIDHPKKDLLPQIGQPPIKDSPILPRTMALPMQTTVRTRSTTRFNQEHKLPRQTFNRRRHPTLDFSSTPGSPITRHAVGNPTMALPTMVFISNRFKTSA